MDNVYYTLLELTDASGKKDKERILAENGSDIFKRVLRVALDPFVTYGIKKLPEVKGGDMNDQFLAYEWHVLDQLASRELSGNAAKATIGQVLCSLKPEHAEVFRRILLKDLRCGVQASTVNKVFPGLVPEFSCMLAYPLEEARITDWPMLVQPKLDGVRTLVFVDTKRESVRFFSRSGKEFTAYESLAPIVLDTVRRSMLDQYRFFEDGRLVLDGEVTSGGFLDTVGAVRRKNKDASDAVLSVFDVLPMSMFTDGADFSLGASARWGLACKLNLINDRVRAIDGELAYTVGAVYDIYDEIRARGGEGVIVKDPDAPYELKRSYAWMKIKDCQSTEGRIVGIEEGTGKYVGAAGAIVLDVDGIQVRVGSGLTDDLRAELWATFLTEPSKLLGRLVEVEFHEKMPSGSLRHPRLKRFRDELTGAFE